MTPEPDRVYPAVVPLVLVSACMTLSLLAYAAVRWGGPVIRAMMGVG